MVSHTSTTDSFRKIFELPNIVSNVVEMQMVFHNNITPELVHRFLKQSQKLRKLSFHICLPAQNFIDLNDEWKCYTIHPYERPALTTYADIDVYKCFVIEKIIP